MRGETPIKVVVLGGSIEGCNIARLLDSDAKFFVTLIDSKNFFEYKSSLIRSLVSNVEPCFVEYKSLLFNGQFVASNVENISTSQVVLVNGKTIDFDYLFISSGRLHYNSNLLISQLKPWTFTHKSFSASNNNNQKSNKPGAEMIEKIIKDKTEYAFFLRYCQKSFCHEGLLFTEAVSQYKDAINKKKENDKILKIVTHIKDSFLLPTSQFEINISSQQKEDILKSVLNAEKSKTFDIQMFEELRHFVIADLTQVAQQFKEGEAFKRIPSTVDERKKYIERESEIIKKSNSIFVIGDGLASITVAAELKHSYPKKKIVLFNNEIGSNLDDEKSLSKCQQASISILNDVGVEVRKEQILKIKQMGTSSTSPYLVATDKSFLECDKVILCDGQTANTSFMAKNFSKSLESNGKIKVNEFLQVEGTNNIFACGSCSTAKQLNKGENGLLQSTRAVKNMIRLVENKLPKHTFKSKNDDDEEEQITLETIKQGKSEEQQSKFLIQDWCFYDNNMPSWLRTALNLNKKPNNTLKSSQSKDSLGQITPRKRAGSSIPSIKTLKFSTSRRNNSSPAFSISL